MKKVILFFCILAIASGMGFAVDFTQGPESVWPGDILISGGFSMGSTSGSYEESGSWSGSASASTSGFTLAVDYALEMYGLTVGGEIAYTSGSTWDFSLGAMAFMGRLGYHPDFEVFNLDLYALAKLGFARGSAGDVSALGLGIGFGIGGRYFFSGNLGGFAELGLDSYFFSVNEGYISYDVTGKKFFTLGITYRL